MLARPDRGFGRVEYGGRGMAHPRGVGAVVILGNTIARERAGRYDRRGGANDEAESLYRKSVAAEPANDENQANLGVMVAARAVSELSEAGSPTRAPAERQALAEAGNKHLEEARQHLAVAVGMKPANAEYQGNYCFVLQRMGRLDQAIAVCQAALAVKPDSADARFNLANALIAQGKTAAAEAELSRVVLANPKYEAARTALEYLRAQTEPARQRE